MAGWAPARRHTVSQVRYSINRVSSAEDAVKDTAEDAVEDGASGRARTGSENTGPFGA